eukprot:TRINITY_DN72684_c0_g1_i1.p1 TRINITY_DN72684_c0_g1~~TRINITY_DN72684_c0_g1_i1.p1  ORF type:complete len:665 (-),score=185.55 TRINITY_DN72684_c0_g1_i1:70-2064(-)
MDDDDDGVVDFSAGLLQGLGLDGSLGPELSRALAGLPPPEWPVELPPDFPQMPPGAFGGLDAGIFESLCKGMMSDIHRCHSMSQEEKETKLRQIDLEIPGAPHGRSVRLLEDPSGAMAARATGTVLWPGSGALIEWLDKDEALSYSFAGSSPAAASASRSSAASDRSRRAKRQERLRAVELGAGLGAVGLYLALHRGCEVVLTDTEEVLPLLSRNVAEHYPSDAEDKAAAALAFNWGDKGQLATVIARSGGAAVDLVVGSDVTYRPECLEILIDSAASLLRPGGRLVLALQDREGEAAMLEATLGKCSEFLDFAKTEAPPAGLLAARKASPDGGGGQDFNADGTEMPRVWIYEVVRASDPAALAAAAAAEASNDGERHAGSFATPEAVEEEFRRITGVDVEPLLPSGAWLKKPEADKSSEKAASPSQREMFINSLLDRDLGNYLCQMDDGLAEQIARLDPGDRPKTEAQQRRFAEAFYAEGGGSRGAASGAAAAAAESASTSSATALAARAAALAECSPEEAAAAAAVTAPCGAPGAAELPAAASSPSGTGSVVGSVARDVKDAAGADVKVCMEGLEWRVDVNEAERELSATVTFGAEVWCQLNAGGGSFKDAVDFELADQDFRVRHFGTSVLELHLHRSVDAHSAVAKVSGKHRRVTVRAPLF